MNEAIRTGIAWSSAFADYGGRSGAAFLPTGEYGYLPRDPWDRGERVSCLFNVLGHVRDQLAGVVFADFAPASMEDVPEYHSETYISDLRHSQPEALDAASAP